MGISAIAYTDTDFELGQLMCSAFESGLELSYCADKELFSWARANFLPDNTLVFICETETALSAAAPLLRGNSRDAALIIVDRQRGYILPLLLHGDTEQLAADISKAIGIPAVLSDSFRSKNLFDIAAWADTVGLRMANPELAKRVSAKLFDGEAISYSSIFQIAGAAPDGIKESSSKDACDFIITYLSSAPDTALHLVPPVLSLGLLCTGDVSVEELEAAFGEFMKSCGCHPLAVRELCTTSTCAQAAALAEFCARHELELSCFDPAAPQVNEENLQISLDPIFSDTGDCCERCAVCGSRGGTLFVRKSTFDGISMALAITEPISAENN